MLRVGEVSVDASDVATDLIAEVMFGLTVRRSSSEEKFEATLEPVATMWHLHLVLARR